MKTRHLIHASLLLCMLLSAHARAADLTIYTYDSFVSDWGAGKPIQAAFEKQCACRIEFVALADGAAILNLVRLEGKHTRADIVLGLDNNLMADAKKTNLFAQVEIDKRALSLPIPWNSDIFVPYDYGYFAFVYDTHALKNPPRSMHELINSPENYQIIIQDPRTSTPGLGLLLWMRYLYDEQAPEQWRKLKRRILTVTKGWSEAYFSLFLNGEAPMVLSYTTSPAYHMAVDKTDRYQAAAFDEGHYLQVEVAAMLKTTKNPKLAREFLRFIHSVDFQSVLPLTNVMYPAVDIGDRLPSVFNQLVQPRSTLVFDPAQLDADERKMWVDSWLDSMSR